eukprot:GHVU01144636.1.p2 GENE.GHVU01144636.1~~GHVU01144636.1.p2  ORF type:complete len:115 (-),score=10.74 GHVU01144636.1:71-415(-)
MRSTELEGAGGAGCGFQSVHVPYVTDPFAGTRSLSTEAKWTHRIARTDSACTCKCVEAGWPFAVAAAETRRRLTEWLSPCRQVEWTLIEAAAAVCASIPGGTTVADTRGSGWPT